MKKKHKCQESRSCCCSMTALEPDDDCPIHGYPFPPRCEICGCYMRWPKEDICTKRIDCNCIICREKAELIGPN